MTVHPSPDFSDDLTVSDKIKCDRQVVKDSNLITADITQTDG